MSGGFLYHRLKIAVASVRKVITLSLTIQPLAYWVVWELHCARHPGSFCVLSLADLVGSSSWSKMVPTVSTFRAARRRKNGRCPFPRRAQPRRGTNPPCPHTAHCSLVTWPHPGVRSLGHAGAQRNIREILRDNLQPLSDSSQEKSEFLG